MFYERKIKYLDNLVHREKSGNAGFVKLEARGDICNIQFHISNLGPGESKPLKVYFIADGGELELCVLDVFGGKGMKTLMAQPLNNLGGTGITYEQLEAVRIPISEERELYAQVGQAKEPDIAETEEKESDEEQSQIICAEVEIQKRDEGRESEKEAKKSEDLENEKEAKEIENQDAETSGVDMEPTVPLCETKWKQLWKIYPHIYPFRDEREYLSMGPEDFVILPERYFCMVNNSFLLHGYYNYKHLVLKRAERQGDVRYYIGVPGNFYDREKQVAVMFGFESFECQVEPANAGDYGYYMMRIEL